MLALVSDPNNNLVKLLVKGADSVILERLSADNKHEVMASSLLVSAVFKDLKLC